MRMRSMATLAACLTLLAAAPAWATVLQPNGYGDGFQVASIDETLLGTSVVHAGEAAFVATASAHPGARLCGAMEYRVLRDPAGGRLDFVYRLRIDHPDFATSDVQDYTPSRYTYTGFAGASTDVYVLNGYPGAVPFAPHRSVDGDRLSFGDSPGLFFVDVPEVGYWTNPLVVRTDAADYGFAPATIDIVLAFGWPASPFAENYSGMIGEFDPVTVLLPAPGGTAAAPEPSTLLLLALGAASLAWKKGRV